MLIIRFSRIGRNNARYFRLIVTEKTNPSAQDGKFVERLGHYSPAGKKPEFVFAKDRVEYWISKGAGVSETAARLFKKNGMNGMEKFVDFSKKYADKKKGKGTAEEKPAETKTEEVKK